MLDTKLIWNSCVGRTTLVRSLRSLALALFCLVPSLVIAQRARLDARRGQKLAQQLPLDLMFRDESGQSVKLGQYFGQKPVVLALVYYDCPMLCTQVLNGMVESFRVLPFQLGNEYDVVTISFDPRETPQLAEKKKKVYVGYLPEKMRSRANAGWHFLTGDADSIRQITDAVGFLYRYD